MNIDRPLDELVREARQQRAVERRKQIRSRRNKQRVAKKNLKDEKSDMDIDQPPKEKMRGGIKKKRRAKAGAQDKVRMDVEVVRNNKQKANAAKDANANDGNARNDALSGNMNGNLVKKVNKGAKISVSNLDHGVTQTDIAELFETVGQLKSARLILMPDGRSTGSAEVVFEHMADALDAIKRYNNVPLDNRPLKISLATDSAPIRIGRARRGNRKMIIDPSLDAEHTRQDRVRVRDHDRDFSRDRDLDRIDDRDADRADRQERDRVDRFPQDGRRRRFFQRRPTRNRNAQGYEGRPPVESDGMYLD